MHTHFADWHREAAVDPAGLPLTERWTVVETSARQLTADRVRDLVEWSYVIHPNPESPGWLRESFQGAEVAFAMRGNDREVAVLAAAILIAHLETKLASAHIASLAVECASHRFPDPVVKDLQIAARNHLTDNAVTMRDLGGPSLPAALPAVALDKKVVAALKEATPAVGSPEWSEAIVGLLNSVDSGLNALRTYASQISNHARATEKTQGEEIDILWWLMADRSTHLNCSWGSLEPQSKAVAAGMELGALTRYPLPHPATRGFLDRALREPVSDQAIEAPETETGERIREWAEATRVASGFGHLAPMVSGLADGVSAGGLPWRPEYGTVSQRAEAITIERILLGVTPITQ